MKKISVLFLTILLAGTFLSACSESSSSAQQTMEAQNKAKLKQSAKVMQQVQVPAFDYSVERENIAKRLTTTNNPNLLQWIYISDNGRVLGRFPVRGKVTSGTKRLTSTQMKIAIDEGEYGGETLGEAPDEMGTYGPSGEYVFWFDPAGQYHQWNGTYFLSPVPYEIDKGYGTISVDIDQAEQAKVSQYDAQSKAAGVKK